MIAIRAGIEKEENRGGGGQARVGGTERGVDGVQGEARSKDKATQPQPGRTSRSEGCTLEFSQGTRRAAQASGVWNGGLP